MNKDTKEAFEFNTVEEALQDLKKGKIILCTDDPDRENEGDFICAGEFATTENINFMAMHGRGLICMPVDREICNKLNLTQMVSENTDNHETAFTVSVDHIDTGTGISAEERALTTRMVAAGKQCSPCGRGESPGCRTTRPAPGRSRCLAAGRSRACPPGRASRGWPRWPPSPAARPGARQSVRLRWRAGCHRARPLLRKSLRPGCRRVWRARFRQMCRA